MENNSVCTFYSATDVCRPHYRGCKRRLGRISFDPSEDQHTLFLREGIIPADILIVHIY